MMYWKSLSSSFLFQFKISCFESWWKWCILTFIIFYFFFLLSCFCFDRSSVDHMLFYLLDLMFNWEFRNDGMEDHYSILIRFDCQESTDSFYRHFNMKHFSSLEVCSSCSVFCSFSFGVVINDLFSLRIAVCRAVCKVLHWCNGWSRICFLIFLIDCFCVVYR